MRQVFIAEDFALADDRAGDGWFTGRFSAHVEDDPGLGDEADDLGAASAVAWGRARAGRVLLRIGEDEHCSVGDEPIPGEAHLAGPDELPPTPRRRPRDEAWKDRGTVAGEIEWIVPLHCSPEPWRVEHGRVHAEVERMVARSAGAKPPRHRRRRRRGISVEPVIGFEVFVTAPNRELAVEAAIARCEVPAGWKAETLPPDVRPAGAGGEPPPADCAFRR